MAMKYLCDDGCGREHDCDPNGFHGLHDLPAGWSTVQIVKEDRAEVTIGGNKLPHGVRLSLVLVICPNCTEKRLGGLPFKFPPDVSELSLGA